MEWIKCSDRLPLEVSNETFRSISVIVTNGLDVGLCDCQAGDGWFEWSSYGDINAVKITHWMPLPEPPTE